MKGKRQKGTDREEETERKRQKEEAAGIYIRGETVGKRDENRHRERVRAEQI
jgi:hypothetical protein